MLHFGHIKIKMPAKQAIFILHANHTGQALDGRNREPPHRSPCAFIRQANMADFAVITAFFKMLKNLDHMIKHLVTILTAGIIGPVLPKHIRPTVGPM